mmetsp:Transcript_34893/g.65068  ORF Transcript_34893/g.65068 Transcript_34893/m.65068 type:complete len:205 (+) Transcript_34893:1104-1718(+)
MTSRMSVVFMEVVSNTRGENSAKATLPNERIHCEQARPRWCVEHHRHTRVPHALHAVKLSRAYSKCILRANHKLHGMQDEHFGKYSRVVVDRSVQHDVLLRLGPNNADTSGTLYHTNKVAVTILVQNRPRPTAQRHLRNAHSHSSSRHFHRFRGVHTVRPGYVQRKHISRRRRKHLRNIQRQSIICQMGNRQRIECVTSIRIHR